MCVSASSRPGRPSVIASSVCRVRRALDASTTSGTQPSAASFAAASAAWRCPSALIGRSWSRTLGAAAAESAWRMRMRRRTMRWTPPTLPPPPPPEAPAAEGAPRGAVAEPPKRRGAGGRCCVCRRSVCRGRGCAPCSACCGGRDAIAEASSSPPMQTAPLLPPAPHDHPPLVLGTSACA
eukprot:207401-Chlamydomonas_euryale.AAC.3